MSLAKRFPTEVNKEITTKETRWEEYNLTQKEEKLIHNQSVARHKALFAECFSLASKIIEDEGAKPYQTSLVNVAIALFNKHARHEHFMQEEFLRLKHEKKYT